MRPFGFLGIMVAVCFLGLLSCGSDDQTTTLPITWPDGGERFDTGIIIPTVPDLGAPPDGLRQDDGAPVINVLSPKEGEVVLGDSLLVQAEITDPDGLDDQKITVTPQGQSPVRMSITSTPNVYEARIDITTFLDQARLWVSAADLTGNVGTKIVNFKRDPGPRIIFFSPAAEGRYKGSVSVQLMASDSYGVTNMEVRLGSYKLTLKQQNTDNKRPIYTASIKFDDPAFVPPLSGKQVLIATAENTNKAKSSIEQVFYIDDQGPDITITSQKAGDLIGGIIQISATVTDPAGVIPSSVICVIGNNLDTRSVTLKNTQTTPLTYEGLFDTRTLSYHMLWPVMSFRATDKLGNENHVDIQVGLDNAPPIVELDPTTEFYYARKVDEIWQCSLPFDPVGYDAANDENEVSQLIRFRARIEDEGNSPYSYYSYFEPISTINDATTRLYVLDNSAVALTVDLDGDGYCDDINPEVIPIGSQPQPGNAVAVNLAPIPPTGSANFTPPKIPIPLPSACDSWGDDTKAPDTLCDLTASTVAIYYSGEALAATYSIPPIVPGNKLKCNGIPFDTLANSISDGWICAAVVADDNLGNRGVSFPMRLFVRNNLSSPRKSGTPPNCTGTLDKTTGKIDSTKPCKYRNPRVSTSSCDWLMEYPQSFCPIVRPAK